MHSDTNPVVSNERGLAYTTPRPDVHAMVPPTALRILDVGCSNGALGRALKSSRSARTVSGIEIDPSLSREAARHLDRVFNADLNNMPWRDSLGDEEFDCIIFADVLEHLVDPVQCLRGACEHLSREGSAIVSVPNIRHISALWSVFVRGNFPRRERGLFDSTHLRWFTTADAFELIGQAGLEVQEMTVALRMGDRGGGRLNRVLNRLPEGIRRWGAMRELFGYQICLRCRHRAKGR